MSFPKDDDELAAALSEAFPPPPKADFDTWQRQHAETVAFLNPQRVNTLSRRRRITSRTAVFAATAALLVCVWLGTSHFANHGPGDAAFAQTLEQITKAKTVTWKTTHYEHSTSKDGKRTWLLAHTTSHAYKSPGLWHAAPLDKNFGEGGLTLIEVEDYASGASLYLDPTKKRAILHKFKPFDVFRGPFDGFREELEKPSLQWIEKRKTATAEVNVFRYAFKDDANKRDWSYDFWIDANTKQLVEVHVPGADIYDPENDPLRNNPPEKAWSERSSMGEVFHDIVFDARVDDSLFRLEPPEGYAVESHGRRHVTEQEMLDYLGIVADFNDKTFPDQDCPIFDVARLNEALKKAERERTEAERKFLEAFMRYQIEGILPVGEFVEQNAVEKSFRYLGKGVKLGDRDRIVCWYKLKGAKTYRVVYGDLRVKDVAAKDLPLPVGP